MGKIKENSTNQLNKQFLGNSCPEVCAMQLLGGQWVLAICSILLEGTCRFSELKKHLSNISERMLTLHLRKMEVDGLVVRKVYPEVPSRVEYSLTSSGMRLKPIVKQLEQWAREHESFMQSQNQSVAC